MVRREELEDCIADVVVLLVHDRVAATFDQDLRVDETGERDDGIAELQGVRHRQRVGVARHGDEVLGREHGRLLEDSPTYLGQGETLGGRIILRRAAGMLHGLERDATDTGLLHGEVDDLAELVVIESLLHDDDQRRADTVTVEILQGLASHVAHVLGPQVAESRLLEAVELQIHLEAGHVRGQTLREGGVLRDADAVGVQHQVLDGALLRGIEDVPESRMDGWLAARDLHDVRLAFGRDDGIQHAFDVLEAAVGLAFRSRGGVTRGTAQVARIRHLDQGEARVLFVVGAHAAIVRAPPFHRGLVDETLLGWFDEDLAAAAIVFDVVRQQDLLAAVLRATLEHVHGFILENDLALDLAVTGGAEARGRVVEQVGADLVGHAMIPR